MADSKTIFVTDTPYGHYEVVDGTYDGRPARVLYSGDKSAAQSGVAHDDEPDLLFDYNQRFLELAMQLRPERVLLIGGGAFTFPLALHYALPDVMIDVVELDEALYDIAVSYFGLPTDERLTYVRSEGRAYLQASRESYDMIVIDAFMHTTIPAALMTVECTKLLRDHLTKDGVVAMNIISGFHSPRARPLRQLYAAFAQTFDAVDVLYASTGYTLWLPQNFVLCGQVGPYRDLPSFSRYGAVSPPDVHPSDARFDADL